ncbi:MAG: ImmA/IrrE family metallo-endopeptidase [Nitrospinota bacterium]
MLERGNFILGEVDSIHRKMGFHTPPFSIRKFLLHFPEYSIRPISMPQGVDGMLRVVEGRPFILFRMESLEERNRLTIAHEVGHHRLGHPIQEEHLYRENMGMHTSDPREEQEAFFFASELLVPLSMLNRYFPDDPLTCPTPQREKMVGELAKVFLVSKALMRRRLRDLGFMRRMAAGAEL